MGNQESGDPMSLAIVDAREWQRVLDLETGQKVERDGPVLQMMKGVLQRHPYPGDTAAGSGAWVTDTALDLIEQYDPGFVSLSYAHLYFSARFMSVSEVERKAMVLGLFEEIARFVKASGFTPVVLGTGGMTPLVDVIDLSRLDGLALCTLWSARYCGLHGPSDQDMDAVARHPWVERIVARQEFLTLFGGTATDGLRLPDFILVSRPGYGFKAAGVPLRRTVNVSAPSFSIPLHQGLGEVRSLTEICGLIEREIGNRRIALIHVEGVGESEFPWPYTPCSNGREWYYYEPSEAQYLAATTGKHQVFAFPVGARLFDDDSENEPYPFSGYFNRVPDGTVGQRLSVRSMAVGNRSMFPHMVYGADVSIECFARNLYNQGCTGVIHRDDKA